MMLRLSTGTVSYTHLDVYKRQGLGPNPWSGNDDDDAVKSCRFSSRLICPNKPIILQLYTAHHKPEC